jgi:hypothetical protein
MVCLWQQFRHAKRTHSNKLQDSREKAEVDKLSTLQQS